MRPRRRRLGERPGAGSRTAPEARAAPGPPKERSSPRLPPRPSPQGRQAAPPSPPSRAPRAALATSRPARLLHELLDLVVAELNGGAARLLRQLLRTLVAVGAVATFLGRQRQPPGERPRPRCARPASKPTFSRGGNSGPRLATARSAQPSRSPGRQRPAHQQQPRGPRSLRRPCRSRRGGDGGRPTTCGRAEATAGAPRMRPDRGDFRRRSGCTAKPGSGSQSSAAEKAATPCKRTPSGGVSAGLQEPHGRIVDTPGARSHRALAARAG
jgi:hypothetical protein